MTDAPQIGFLLVFGGGIVAFALLLLIAEGVQAAWDWFIDKRSHD